jgi:hypothetical protein
MSTRSTRHRRLSQRLPTNQRTPARGTPRDVGPLLIPHAQTAKLIEPGKRPLHDPPLPAQSTPVRGATHGEPRHDMPRPQSAPNRRRVVAATQSGRCRGRPRSRCSGGIASTNARASCESFRFAPVRRTASGTPRPSQIRWRLLPRLARSVGFGPVWSPPYTARTEQLSTTARDQSIWSERASQSRSAKWIRSHMPACCQSRTRRQHVIPDPHPSSCGSICQGMPRRRTKRMPVRHAHLRRAAVRLLADGGELARSVRQDPTTDLEAAQRPYLFTLLRR